VLLASVVLLFVVTWVLFVATWVLFVGALVLFVMLKGCGVVFRAFLVVGIFSNLVECLVVEVVVLDAMGSFMLKVVEKLIKLVLDLVL
jgi:hypothetical protein